MGLEALFRGPRLSLFSRSNSGPFSMAGRAARGWAWLRREGQRKGRITTSEKRTWESTGTGGGGGVVWEGKGEEGGGRVAVVWR